MLLGVLKKILGVQATAIEVLYPRWLLISKKSHPSDATNPNSHWATKRCPAHYGRKGKVWLKLPAPQ